MLLGVVTGDGVGRDMGVLDGGPHGWRRTLAKLWGGLVRVTFDLI